MTGARYCRLKGGYFFVSRLKGYLKNVMSGLIKIQRLEMRAELLIAQVKTIRLVIYVKCIVLYAVAQTTKIRNGK